MSTSGPVPDTQNVDGNDICVYFDPLLYRAVDDFEPQEDDVIQVTFPRSGTHWAQQIIQLIVHGGKSASSFTEFTERAPFLEMQGLKTTGKPRLLRSHLPIGKVPFSPRGKYVYVARNPWDCCVSCYHLVHEAPAFNFSTGTFEEFVDVFLGGQFGFGNYFEHVLSGYKHKDKPNVFFLTYEELQKNKPDAVLRLAYFLGKGYGRMLEENENVFKEVLDKSTVSFMKGFMRPSPEELNLALGKTPAQFERLKEVVTIKADGAKVNILRKGEMGQWKNYFTPETSRKMQATIDEMNKKYGIIDLWKQTL
ncbi:sulfotransferase ssu-1-like [Ixodes scapularis]|uniref:sulfotransferase ssu-1-like n=1 Tax=Ixodes scapularis TaxID=6945 RepID=UPI001A9D098F|nr:sulfotransferase ssu-1-like [Ixodes scapularis]XP_040071786.1 sulfotransferase ssu-1-like [Ixodes scapularis]